MTLSSRVLQWFVPLFVLAGIGISMGTGWWVTESSKIPATYQEGEYAGRANPADIRGSYSLNDITTAFGIPVPVLEQAFALPPESDNVQVKRFEEMYGQVGAFEIGTDAMRLFVARYLGLPYEPEESTGVLAPAVDLIRSTGNVDLAVLNDLERRIVHPEVASSSADAVQAGADGESEPTAPTSERTSEAPSEGQIATAEEHIAISPEEHIGTDDRLVRGQTTFGELLLWGAQRDDVERVLGKEIGPRTMLLRDFCIEAGISFSAVKGALQELVDEQEGDE
jgi:hypothetical protein